MIVKSFLSGPLAVNCYVAADEVTKKAFIVDPGGYNENMVNYIKENQFEVEYIILTHGHGDHIGGVSAVRKEFPEAKLLACLHERAMLEDANLNMSPMTVGTPVSLQADIYVTDGETLKVGDMELKFLHTPGTYARRYVHRDGRYGIQRRYLVPAIHRKNRFSGFLLFSD